MKIYLSIPITGLESTLKERYKKTYTAIKKDFIKSEIISPIDINNLNNCLTLTTNNDIAYFMGKNIEKLLRCDAIYMSEGWQYSKGCQAELKIAEIFGLHIFYNK